MMRRKIFSAGLLFLLLGGGAVFHARSAEKAEGTVSAPSKSPAADLYSLTEALSRRARDLDQADLRIQEERKILEKMREEVRQQIGVMEQKLSMLEKRAGEQEQGSKVERQRVARIFRAMPAEDAAKRLQMLGERDSARILKELKEKDAAKILGRMDTEFSANVTRWMEKGTP
jgi:flagellar motility protein MotE (MotC chaperone)